jgi:hypothetical protein
MGAEWEMEMCGCGGGFLIVASTSWPHFDFTNGSFGGGIEVLPVTQTLQRGTCGENTPTFRTVTSSCRLAGTGKGRTTSPLHWLSLPSAPTNLSLTYSRRLATLVAQPVTITFPLVSKISRATVSVNASPSILTSMARVSLCVCIQTPAGLKTKASVTAL